jgi:lipopolysaccharide export system protein LptA
VQRFYILILIIFFPSVLLSQERTKIILQSSSSLLVDTKTKINYVKNPVFRQDNATLTCDSAVFYKERNYFEAYKNVRINQGDTVNIYSDFLNYDGNKKLAQLTSNVRMVDATSVLTTNTLDYFMTPKIGKYYNGGKIVNQEVTLTSKNGWYFAFTNDAYFRYNVVVVTPQSTIKSDTLRYNTATNWTYFYGPTNIKGKKENLYTEDGAYNTRSENAYFGKKNLYTEGTRSLKGDSLYYNGKSGYGKAVKNIVFMDSSDKTLLRGQKGEYYSTEERVVVTKNAYFGMGTTDSVILNNKKIADTLWLGADTLEARKSLQKTIKLISKPVVQKDNEVGIDNEVVNEEKQKLKAEAKKQLAVLISNQTPTPTPSTNKKLTKKEKKQIQEKEKLTVAKPTQKIDSVKLNLDTLKKDTSKISPVVLKTKDSIKITKPLAQKTSQPKNKTITKNNTIVKAKKDSVISINPADTVTTRVIKAYHNVRVFKSNLQAQADSLFYSAADSVLRWYKNPILWSEGSQQSGDTIYVFLKNNKTHSFQVLQNGFIVNVETDSTKFNQVKGKKITAFFTEGELKNVYVDGNAESMYYTKNDKEEYDKLSQSVSSRIRFKFNGKELDEISFIKEDEGVTYPIDNLPKEVLLTGFIWKPELRPTSKADIIKGNAKKAIPKIIKPKTTKPKPQAAPKKAVKKIK